MKYLLIISALLFSSLLIGQEELHTRRSRYKEAYQEAKSLVEVGNLYQSAEILKEVLSKDESFDEAIMLLHEIYIKRDEPSNANAIIVKYAKELESPFLNRLFVIQANYAYQMGQYEEARMLIDNVSASTSGIDSAQVQFLRQSIGFSIEESSNPMKIDFEKLPSPVNEFTMQYFPSITRSGQLVYTMRDQLGRSDEDLVTTTWIGNRWTKPMPLSININTDRNEGAASISADGKTLVFTSCNRPDNIGSCDLYISNLGNGGWTSPELLGAEVNSKEWDSQPSLSADGKKLFFVSKRGEGVGKDDIWLSELIDGKWQRAKNLGPIINTPEDDSAPFIYVDGETLIFASKGRIGMGGYDLFKSVRQNEVWSEPENLGYPINNSFDQIGYSIAADQWAYFSSSDSSGRILLQRFKVPDEVIQAEVAPEVQFKGRVIDATTQQLLSAELALISANDTTNISINNDGLFSLKDLQFNSIKAKKKGYRSVLLNRASFLKDSTIRLSPFFVGEKLESSPLLFGFDSAELTPQSLAALDNVLEILKQHAELKVEVRGYTDATGNRLYNQELSERRAQAVYKYLVNRLVGRSSSLSAAGLGQLSANQVDGNPQASVLSRKVELVIVEIIR